MARSKGGRPLGAKNDPDRKPLPFRQADLKRCLRAMRSEGVQGQVEINPRTGRLYIIPNAPAQEPTETQEP